jgi:hypothetical protein
MPVTLGDQITQNMRQKTTEDLLAIWVSNDRGQWSDAAFDAVSMILSERGVLVPPQVVLAPPPPVASRYKGVKGWLLLFCISLTVLNPLVAIIRLGHDIEFVSRFSSIYPALRTELMIDGILSVAITGFSIYAGICLWRVASRAVQKAQTLLLCLLVYAAIVAFLPLMVGLPIPGRDAIVFETIKSGIVPSIIYFWVWNSYLNTSERVKATYDITG